MARNDFPVADAPIADDSEVGFFSPDTQGKIRTSCEINRSLLDKTANSFYVEFYQLENNISNILGRHVLSIERPAVTFLISETFEKGKKTYHNERLDLQQLTVTFSDDNDSLATRIMYDQVYKQAGTRKRATDELFDDSKFSLRTKMYNLMGDNVEEFTLSGCFISNVTHSEQIYAESTRNIISVGIQYDDICFKFPKLEST